MSVSYRLGFDIGGTFTDFTLVNESTGEILVEKCLTSPHDPEQAVLTGIKKLAAQAPEFLAATREAIHATTLLTNVAHRAQWRQNRPHHHQRLSRHSGDRPRSPLRPL